MATPRPADPSESGSGLLGQLSGAKPASAELPGLPSPRGGPASRMPGQVTAKNNPGSLASPDFTKKAMEPGASYKSMFSDVRSKSADLQATHAADRAATPPPSRVADFARGAGGIAPKAASSMAAPAAGAAAPVAGALVAPSAAAAAGGAAAATPMLSFGSQGASAAATAQNPAELPTAEGLLTKAVDPAAKPVVGGPSSELPDPKSPGLLDSLTGQGGPGGADAEDPASMGALMDSLMGPMPSA